MFFVSRSIGSDRKDESVFLSKELEKVRKNQNGWADNEVDELTGDVVWDRESNGYCLLTEAEWEYCVRGGEAFVYAGSNELEAMGWYTRSSGDETHPAGQKRSNGFGVYDMSGNVSEWVWDWWGDT